MTEWGGGIEKFLVNQLHEFIPADYLQFVTSFLINFSVSCEHPTIYETILLWILFSFYLELESLQKLMKGLKTSVSPRWRSDPLKHYNDAQLFPCRVSSEDNRVVPDPFYPTGERRPYSPCSCCINQIYSNRLSLQGFRRIIGHSWKCSRCLCCNCFLILFSKPRPTPSKNMRFYHFRWQQTLHPLAQFVPRRRKQTLYHHLSFVIRSIT